MNTTISWSERALLRVGELGDFLARRSPKAAETAIGSLFDAVDVLTDHPELGKLWAAGPSASVRVLYHGHYAVYYEFTPSTNTIAILTVRHQREAPPARE